MSKIAHKIATSPAPDTVRTRRGPANACYPLYGEGDLADWEAVENLRIGPPKLEWRDVQAHIDGLLDVAQPLPLEKFRYHWRRRCYCWPEDLRR
ncbi:hypothetical protein [Arthrobacter sp. Alg241-R88]|uniref:hypothetical protein n=1 Tax=Arthrobacter sp. Alg241-R88 TaxID=2305984 RepID=UPI0013D3201D|nr:hypothetical protein [Arthrobacter sp. Alg241-R88]